jgi:SEC-C motif domain protein
MKKNLLAAHAPCPCESGRTYFECCGPFHAFIRAGLVAKMPPGAAQTDGFHIDEVHAPTPEALMRSRYSAYVLGLADYLLATWHPSTTPGELELWPVKWLGLEVREHEQSGDAGVVEFVARYRSYDHAGGRAERLHEISRFVRSEGRWYYIDGQMVEPG